MSENKFIEQFAEAIDRAAEIKMGDEFRNYDEWSSIAYLSVIALMDSEYDVQMEEDDFQKLRTVKDVYEVCFNENETLALRNADATKTKTKSWQ